VLATPCSPRLDRSKVDSNEVAKIQAVMNADPARQAGLREWIGLAVLALACVVYAMDLTVLELAVPALSADLEPSSSQLLWIGDIYAFVVAGLLITMGTLGDRIGRRRLLLIGAAAFGGASILASFSSSAEMLIATRALLGVAGATVAPSTLALISDMFRDPQQRTIAIGVWISAFSAGAVIGPLAGGVMLEYFRWGSVFLLGVPVMTLLLVLGPTLLPESRDPAAGRLDLASAAMSLASVLAMIYGLKRIAEDGLGLLPSISTAAGLAVGIAFLLRQRTLGSPLLDLRLFRVPAFCASLATHTLAFFAIGGMFFLTAQYLQLVLGLSPLRAGLWMALPFGGFIVGSMLTPPIVRRVRPAFVMDAGLALATVGFGMLTQVDGISGLAPLVTGSVVFSLGLAPVFTLATDLIVGSAPPERAGAASAISETGSEFGAALGIAILGSVGTAVYRNQVTDSVPVGVPPEAAEAARDTLGAAVAAARQLPDRLGGPLLDVTREAFVHELRVTAVTCAVIAMSLTILVTLLLRHVGAAAEPKKHPGPDHGVSKPAAGGTGANG
jgi:MFS transporter, DHA2 family, multidrug resistance protein